MKMDKAISIVTVTKNRLSFVRHLRHNIESLDYDQSLIEWVVVDDGEQSVFDCVHGFPKLVYHYSSKHLPLGRKRNLANTLTSGEIIFNFDDDNYAFKRRIRKSLAFLEENPNFKIVGSSEMFVLDIDAGKVYVAGPFSKNHATLGTWAFHRSLLTETGFADGDCSREETAFTKGWTVRMGQLDKYDTSICVDHGKNTISKKHLLREATAMFTLDEILEDDVSRRYFEGLIGERMLARPTHAERRPY